jgi:hypothetical protein
MMNYFQLGFGYVGSIVTIVSENKATHKASVELEAAIQKVMEALDAIEVEHLHAYAWPDGSLYRFIRTEMGEQELCTKINEALGEGLCIEDVYVQSPEKDPYKGNCNTLEEYFERNKK